MRQARAQRHAVAEGPGSRGSSHSHESRPQGHTGLGETSARPLFPLEEFKGQCIVNLRLSLYAEPCPIGDTSGEDPNQERSMLQRKCNHLPYYCFRSPIVLQRPGTS